jgi:hypothetical protein
VSAHREGRPNVVVAELLAEMRTRITDGERQYTSAERELLVMLPARPSVSAVGFGQVGAPALRRETWLEKWGLKR